MKHVISGLFLCAVIFSACKPSFKKGDKGLEYQIFENGKGSTVKIGDFMQLRVSQLYKSDKKDTTLMDGANNPPQIQPFDSTSVPPEYFKILKLIKAGDSLAIRQSSDTIFKARPETRPPFAVGKGGYFYTTIKVLNIFKTREQADSAYMAEIKLAQTKDSIKAIGQLKIDDSKLADYMKKNNITGAVKSPLGAYVQILQPGMPGGVKIDSSNAVKVNYTGKTLDGTTFDSNTDPSFQHVQPLIATMYPSANAVIKGWTDAMQMLTKGAKAKLLIPSSLAYGSRAQGDKIKADENLIFEVEVLDVLTREQVEAENSALQKKQMEQQKIMQAQQQIAQQKYMDSLQKVDPKKAEELKKQMQQQMMQQMQQQQGGPNQ
jgi:FKBP-type peptidyl-prolyl cis-trans isomerase FkpA